MLLLVYALTLVAAVLVSERANRTVLSTAVLFLVAGVAFGGLHGAVAADVVGRTAELALVSVLYTDGLRLPFRELRGAWALPGRALLLGFPLTLALTAAAARLLTPLSWPAALLVGAALAPTDPVFASAIVGREEVPGRLRHLLNVESGVNDGLALPFVVAFIAWTGRDPFSALAIGRQLALGVVLGLAVPWAAVRLERTPVFGASEEYRAIGVIAIGVLLYALSGALGANAYLASFVGGQALATVAPRAQASLARTGDVFAELLKLGAVLVFGSILSARFVSEISLGGWAFALFALFVARPLAIGIALARTPLDRREVLVAAWFGPKGFASVVYGLLVVAAGLPEGALVFHLVAITTALSILLHSSTDVPIARWLERGPERAEA